MQCNYCGASIEKGIKSCPYCGTVNPSMDTKSALLWTVGVLVVLYLLTRFMG